MYLPGKCLEGTDQTDSLPVEHLVQGSQAGPDERCKESHKSQLLYPMNPQPSDTSKNWGVSYYVQAETCYRIAILQYNCFPTNLREQNYI